MAKSSKPRSTTPTRTTRTRKPTAAPETTIFEEATLTAASDHGAILETTTPPALPHDVIAMRAYELYLGDGAPEGRDLEHWLRAESELRERVSRN